MKRGTPAHPKMKRLARRLEIPLTQAIGIMEVLWHFARDFAPQGDIGRFSDEDLAEAVGWEPGRASGLILALLEERWLDPSERYRLLVHDWSEHAEDYVRKKLHREGLNFIEDIGLTAAAAANGGLCLDKVGKCLDNFGPTRARRQGKAEAAALTAAAIESKTETDSTRAREPELPAPELPVINPEVLEPHPVNGNGNENGNGHSNGNVVKFGLPPIEKQTEYPETVRAVHDYFPETDLGFVRRLISDASHVYACVAKPTCPFSDKLVAEAIRRVYKQSQEGAGLFMRTVPECIRTWALEGMRSRASPPGTPTKTDRAMERLKQELAVKAAKGSA